MAWWTIAKKDLRLLVRDVRAVAILLAMPLVFILVLGVSLGDGFGQKPADRIRVSVLVLDEGPPRFFDQPAMLREGLGTLAAAGPTGGMRAYVTPIAFAHLGGKQWFPRETWAERVLRDLAETADLRIERVADRAEAERLVRTGKRPAVLVLGPAFSKKTARCSFLSPGRRDALAAVALLPIQDDPVGLLVRGLYDERQRALPLYLFDGLNPFHREGVNFAALDVEVLRDPTQPTAAAIIDQVAQGSLLRVVMPWMIGRAFEKISDPQFLALLGSEDNIPGPVKAFLTSPFVPLSQKRQLSTSLQNSLQNLFPRYNLTAKTWAALTKSSEAEGGELGVFSYAEDGTGWLRRGATRYRLLVPSYLVMFAFFLVLTVGWLFVSERRQGTWKRLALSPATRVEILAGKLLPCLVISWFQGAFLLLAGRLLFGMSWGEAPWALAPVVATTSFAAMGLAVAVAAIAKSETQVAVYGALFVLTLAALSGCLMGDRSAMPETMQQVSLTTPHAWALDAYRQLLANPTPDLSVVAGCCAALVGFGLAFLAVAWLTMTWE